MSRFYTEKELADSLSMETAEWEILVLEAQRRDFHGRDRLVENIYKYRLGGGLFVLQRDLQRGRFFRAAEKQRRRRENT